MRETYEFRILEKHADKLFGPAEGRRLGILARKILIDPSDPRFSEIGRLNRELTKNPPEFFFASWNVVRKYTPKEVEGASHFLLRPLVMFEPAGEECGTTYDESAACPICQAGAKQTSPLFLSVGRIPKGRDLAFTIAGEIVVSDRLAELFRRQGITSVSLPLVRNKNAKDLRSIGWSQVLVPGPGVDIVAPTRTGDNPFDDDLANQHRCKRGDTIGLNLLSEVFVSASQLPMPDVVATNQFVGRRGGLLRPKRLLLVSQKVRQLLQENNIKGYRLEIAHLS